MNGATAAFGALVAAAERPVSFAQVQAVINVRCLFFHKGQVQQQGDDQALVQGWRQV